MIKLSITNRRIAIDYPHRIDVEQNKPERLELLRAQRFFYARAKVNQSLFAFTVLLLPIFGVIFGTTIPAISPYLGFGSIFLLLLEVGFVTRLLREDCKRAAKVQEQFDVEVLQLDWNRLVAGSRIDVEELHDIATSPMTNDEKTSLENWYEPAISNLPLPMGRLLCQRTNTTYDMRMRKRYSWVLLGVAVVFVIALTVISMLQDLKVNELIVTVYLPALPLIAFLLREHRKQLDTIETLSTIKSEIEKTWEHALSGASFTELTITARSLQDAIYRHRASNPLVLDWLYNLLRNGNEGSTRFGVEKLVAEAQQKLNFSATK